MKKWFTLGGILIAVLIVIVRFGPEQLVPELTGHDGDRDRLFESDEGEEGEGEEYPNDWFYIQRAYPLNEVPVPARLKAAAEARTFQVAAAAKSAINVTWSEAGPSNIPGRITDIAVHPSQPNVIYEASARPGLTFRET